MSETALLYEPDQTERLIKLIRSQDQSKPRIRALMQGIGSGLQLFEDVNFDLLCSLVFESATGAMLEMWGGLVGEERAGLGDSDYRRFIAARILVNQCRCTPDELIQICKMATGGTVRLLQVDGLEMPFYSLQSQLPVLPSPPMRRRITRTLDAVRPAAVAAHILLGSTSTALFGSGPGWGVGTWGRVTS
jgi:hypothetical protein